MPWTVVPSSSRARPTGTAGAGRATRRGPLAWRSPRASNTHGPAPGRGERRRGTQAPKAVTSLPEFLHTECTERRSLLDTSSRVRRRDRRPTRKAYRTPTPRAPCAAFLHTETAALLWTPLHRRGTLSDTGPRTRHGGVSVDKNRPVPFDPASLSTKTPRSPRRALSPGRGERASLWVLSTETPCAARFNVWGRVAQRARTCTKSRKGPIRMDGTLTAKSSYARRDSH